MDALEVVRESSVVELAEGTELTVRLVSLVLRREWGNASL